MTVVLPACNEAARVPVIVAAHFSLPLSGLAPGLSGAHVTLRPSTTRSYCPAGLPEPVADAWAVAREVNQARRPLVS